MTKSHTSIMAWHVPSAAGSRSPSLSLEGLVLRIAFPGLAVPVLLQEVFSEEISSFYELVSTYRSMCEVVEIAYWGRF